MSHLKKIINYLRNLYRRFSPVTHGPSRPLTSEWQTNLQRNIGFRGRIEPLDDGRYLVFVDRRRGHVPSQAPCEYGYTRVGEFCGYRQAFRAALESAAQLARYRYAYTGLETA